MKFLIPATALAIITTASVVQSQTRADFEATVMVNCQSAGNAATDCACIAQNWANDLSDDDLPLAIAAIEMSMQEHSRT